MRVAARSTATRAALDTQKRHPEQPSVAIGLLRLGSVHIAEAIAVTCPLSPQGGSTANATGMRAVRPASMARRENVAIGPRAPPSAP